MVGHYVGQLDLSPIGNNRLEDVQIALMPGGIASYVTDEDGVETESASLGIWKKTGKNKVKISVLVYRAGDRLCAIIDNRADNRCTLRGTINAKIDKRGNMTGELTGQLEEVNEETGEKIVFMLPNTVPLVNVKRTSFNDFP